MAYILEQDDNFLGAGVEVRHRASFLFEIFAFRKIDSSFFIKLCAEFAAPFVQSAELLVRAVENPCSLERDQSWHWGFTEVCLLIAALAYGNRHVLQQIFPHRGESACMKKYIRIVDDLARVGMFDDVPPARKSVGVQTDDEFGWIKKDKQQACRLLNLKIATQQRISAMKIRQLHAKNAALLKKLVLLERSSIACAEEDQPEMSDEVEQNSTVSSHIISECIELMKNYGSRQKYSPVMLHLAYLLKLTSPKCYRLLRQVLPLPSETCPWNHFAAMTREIRLHLTGREQIVVRVHNILSQIDDKVPCTIGIDAFSFATFCGRTLPERFPGQHLSNGFLFVYIPLDPRYSVRVIHLHPKANGSYDQSIADIFSVILDCFQAHKHRIWFKATDGDRFLGPEHEAFYHGVIESSPQDFFLLIDRLHDFVSEGGTIPIADPLHFGKNIRGKLLDHDVAVVQGGKFVNAEQLQQILELGDALLDTSLLGRMRDCYVTTLFTLRNTASLMEMHECSASLLFLPYSCVYTAVYATNITPETRQFLVKLAYTAFLELLEESRILAANGTGVKHRYQSGAKAVTIAEPDFFRRMIHTCLALGIALVFGPNILRLSAIGTHVVENMIGVARSVSNSPKYESIVSAFANCESRKDLAYNLGMKIHVQRRLNDGGIKANSLSDEGLSYPEHWDTHDIVAMMKESASGFADHSTNGLDVFTYEFRVFVDQLDMYTIKQPNSAANALIVERNRKFRE